MRCLNLGSYNYLGFAQNTGPILEEDIKSVSQYTTSTCASPMEGGKSTLALI